MWRVVKENLGLGGVVGLAALLLVPGAVRADDADTQKMLIELKARMEAMEKQNQQLQQQLQQRRQPGGAEASEQADEGNLTEAAVKRMISDYMRQDAANKAKAQKAADEAYSEVVNNTPMTGVFDNGALLISKNKAFTARVGLEVQTDAGFMNSGFGTQYGRGGIGPISDGINTRRMRIDVRGQAWDNFQYMCQIDWGLATGAPNFENNEATGGLGSRPGVLNGNVFNSPNPTELWGMFTDLPIVRNIRIGNQKPLWSFENWNSSRFQNFMERSLGWDAFLEDQNNGFIPSICMLNWTENERMSYQAGIAKNNRQGFFWHQQNGGDMAEARVSFLPWYCDNGRYLIHLGLGSMYANASNDIGQPNGVVRWRARDLIRYTNNAQQAIMTEARVNADNESRLTPEFYMNLGPFNVQAEYYAAWAGGARTIPTYGIPQRNIGTLFGSSYYVQATYFLTGEYNPYNKQLGRLERVIPHSNFFWTRSNGRSLFASGCWLTGLRYSWIDLRGSGGVNGAGVNLSGAQPASAGVWDVTWTLQWILNPNSRIQWNAIYENRNTANQPLSNGPVRGFGMRYQLDF